MAFFGSYLCLLCGFWPTVPEVVLALAVLGLLIAGFYLSFGAINVIAAVICFLVSGFCFVGVPENGVVRILNSALRGSSYVYFMQGFITLLGGIILCIIASLGDDELGEIKSRHELPVLILLSLLGMVTLVAAESMLSFYVAFELSSIVMYTMAAYDYHSSVSTEAGIKYFVMGALSSCIMLYGMSLLYANTGGSSGLSDLLIHFSETKVVTVGAGIGILMWFLGLCFKMSIFPFHMWAPDVYQGSYGPITAFLMIVPKVAFTGVVIVLAHYLLPIGDSIWANILLILGVLSLLVSSLGALAQEDIKRILAYGSIGHSGYILIAAVLNTSDSFFAALFYNVVYSIFSVGFFAFLFRHRALSSIFYLKSFYKSYPYMAFCASVLLLSMAGIPPFAGFIAKFLVVKSAVSSHMVTLALFAVFFAVISCYYYLNIIRVLYFGEKDQGDGNLVKCITSFGGRFLLPSLVVLSAAFNIGSFLFLSSLRSYLGWALLHL